MLWRHISGRNDLACLALSSCLRQKFFQPPHTAVQLPAGGLTAPPVFARRLQFFSLQLDDVPSLRQTALRLPQHPLKLRPRHMDVRQLLAPVGQLETKVSCHTLLVSDCRFE